jgi:carboxymethylenebutenolidase
MTLKDAYLAKPEGDGPWPGAVVIHEIFGLNDDIRALSDRLASMGYLALAPDLYDGGRWWRCMRVAFRELDSGEGEFFDAIDAARASLADRDDCTGRVGVIGFCLGGSFALLAAPRPGFAVASVNYGHVPEEAESALAGACPIVASYGGRDRSLQGHPERLEAALRARDVEHDFKIYPDAGHSFMNRPYPLPLRPIAKIKGMSAGPVPAAADDAWRRIDAFFARHLKD